MAARIGKDHGGDYTALQIAMVAAVIGFTLSTALARVRRHATRH